jgi:IS5 family transposase
MLSIHMRQQWYCISGSAIKQALIEVTTMRRFISDLIPDETTILTLRHQLEKHKLDEPIVETAKAHLRESGMTMR